MKQLLVIFSLFSGVCHAQMPTNVLFIGNSFTHMHNMPKIFEHLANSKGKHVYADSIAVSGSSLKAHSERPSTYVKMKAKKWDVVFVQGFSREFAEDSSVVRTQSIPYAKMLIDSVLKYSPCAQIYLYMTWGYEKGYPEQPANDTYPKMQERIYNGYMYMSDTLGWPVAPVGMVWQHIREKHPEIDLYFTDRYHPNALGSFAAACTFYAAIYKESPLGGTAPKRVDSTYWKIIENAAATVVLKNYEKYKLNKLRQFEISDSPILDFTYKQTWLSIHLSNKSDKHGEYYWDFGDGETSTKKHPKHYYKKDGTYTVTLHVKYNCSVFTVKKLVTVSKKNKRSVQPKN
jgi:Mor family transcriptional regulator